MKNVTKADIIDFLKHEVSKECEMPVAEVDPRVPFVDFRMDSLKAVYIMDSLEKYIGEELSPLYFWDYPTIDSLSGFICQEILKHPDGSR
ncbi:MAG: acyl carrier protein [Bacteroidota bacterium]|nr:acyl carrier protein [Bacteroidota bacterium]